MIICVLIGLLIGGGVIAYYIGTNSNKPADNIIVPLSLTPAQISRATKAQSNAESVQSVAEIYAADNGYYPGSAEDFMSYSQTTRLPSGITVLPDSDRSPIDAGNGTDHVAWSCLKTCNNSTGGKITYWDYRTNAISTNVLYVGKANASSTFVYPSLSSDDAQRKNDLARLVTALVSYQSNNRGSLPSGMGSSTNSWPSFVERYVKTNGDTFADPTGKDYILSQTATLPSVFDPSNPVILLTLGNKCNGSDLTISESARAVSFYMTLGNNSTYCLNN